MDLEAYYDLIRSEKFDEAHRYLDDELKKPDQEDSDWINYRRANLYICEARYEEAIEHLKNYRNRCGNAIAAHNTLAMIYDMMGKDDLALNELETAPYGTDQDVDPLLTADAKFYRLYLKAQNGLAIAQPEIDEFPDHYQTYLPAGGKMRGALVRKSDIIIMVTPSS